MGQATSTSQTQPPSSCPVNHGAVSKSVTAEQPPAQCPVKHDARNQMPELPQTPISTSQSMALPTERTASSIPRDATTKATWDYPSPQQFYNALVRKGWETPEEHIETMVDIHNFLNEEAWNEVLKWERRHSPDQPLELARFCGRPGDLSPKARLYLLAGKIFPERFNTEPPFDRHDWVVRRPQSGEEVRYVIDYYSAPPLPDGSPVFSLDVRPALDSFASVKERIVVATEEAWSSYKSSREEQKPTQANHS